MSQTETPANLPPSFYIGAFLQKYIMFVFSFLCLASFISGFALFYNVDTFHAGVFSLFIIFPLLPMAILFAESSHNDTLFMIAFIGFFFTLGFPAVLLTKDYYHDAENSLFMTGHGQVHPTQLTKKYYTYLIPQNFKEMKDVKGEVAFTLPTVDNSALKVVTAEYQFVTEFVQRQGPSVKLKNLVETTLLPILIEENAKVPNIKKITARACSSLRKQMRWTSKGCPIKSLVFKI